MKWKWWHEIPESSFHENRIEHILLCAGRKGNEGYVYLIECDGLYKIGMTTNLKKRISQLRSVMPHKVTLISKKYTTDRKMYESLLHSMFSSWRVRGEWFRLDDVLLRLALAQYK